MTSTTPWNRGRPVPQQYWSGSAGRQHAREATQWLLHARKVVDPAQEISLLSFTQARLESMLRQVYGKSPWAALADAGVAIYPWEMRWGPPKNYWLAEAGPRRARQAIAWLLQQRGYAQASLAEVSPQITRADFHAVGLRRMLIQVYKDRPDDALVDYFAHPEAVPTPQQLVEDLIGSPFEEGKEETEGAASMPPPLSTYLQDQLDARHWSIADLARRAQVSSTHIGGLILGNGSASAGVLYKIALALEIDAAHLLDLAALPQTPDVVARSPLHLVEMVVNNPELRNLIDIWLGLDRPDQVRLLTTAQHLTAAAKATPSPTGFTPISDDLWARVVPVLRPTSQGRGRARVDDRAALNGILYCLETGIAWDRLPQRLGVGSGRSCQRRLLEWKTTNIWSQIQQILIEYAPDRQIDWTRAEETG